MTTLLLRAVLCSDVTELRTERRGTTTVPCYLTHISTEDATRNPMGGIYCIRAFRGQVNLGVYQVYSTCICITFLSPVALRYYGLVRLKNSNYF